jgi:hypothetical protein
MNEKIFARHPEVLAVLHGEPQRMGHMRLLPSFDAAQDRGSSG